MLPGAGYLALAIEALTQINQQAENPLSIESYTLRDVVFVSATVVPEDDTGTETMFRMQPVEGKSSKNRWHEFVSSCCSYGSWKETARGKIGLNVVRKNAQPKPPTSPDTHWQRAKHIDWLDKLRTLGFDLGPAFHHIDDIYISDTEHRARAEMSISNECGLVQAESRYLLHPTVIDACLQPSTATIHRGDLSAMRCGTIPTHVSEATLFVPSQQQLAERCDLQVWTSSPMGNRAFQSHMQLADKDGSLLLHISGERHVYYGAAVPLNMQGPMQQDLYLREDWKMDEDYIDQSSVASFDVVVEALIHKEPQATRTLCLDPTLIPSLLAAQSALLLTVAVTSQEHGNTLLDQYGRDQRLTVLELDPDSARTVPKTGPDYDLIVSSAENRLEPNGLVLIREMLAPSGRLVVENGKSIYSLDILQSAGFSEVSVQTLPDGWVLAKKSPVDRVDSRSGNGNTARKSAVLIYRDRPDLTLLSIARQTLEDAAWSVRCQPLSRRDSETAVTPHESVIIVDVELDRGALLATINDAELRGLQDLTETASSITWVTRGGLLDGDRPEYGMTAGAARVMRIEKGSRLDLVTVDYDTDAASEQRVVELLADILGRQQAAGVGHNGETEYIVRSGAVYISRLLPHSDVNGTFVADSGMTSTLRVQHDGSLPAVHGELDQVSGAVKYCLDGDEDQDFLRPDDVEVQVAAIGLTAVDGADDAGFLSHQLAGTVSRAGEEAVKLFPRGSRVAGFASSFNGRLGTVQRASSCHLFPLVDGNADIDMVAAASVPSTFTTAIYGLEELARVDVGENVVVIDGMGAVGWAAVQICRVLGANVVVVTSSRETERLLADSKPVGPSCKVLLWGCDGQEDEESCLRGSMHDVCTAWGGSIDAVLCSASVSETSTFENIGPCLSPVARIVVTLGERRGNSANGSKGLLLSSIPAIKGLSLFHFELKDMIERRPVAMAR